MKRLAAANAVALLMSLAVTAIGGCDAGEEIENVPGPRYDVSMELRVPSGVGNPFEEVSTLTIKALFPNEEPIIEELPYEGGRNFTWSAELSEALLSKPVRFSIEGRSESNQLMLTAQSLIQALDSSMMVQMLAAPVYQIYELGALERGVIGATVTPLDNGKVLVVGGVENGRWNTGLTETANYVPPQMYSHLSGKSCIESGAGDCVGLDKDAMPLRVGHTATLLSDGRVAIIGGFERDSGQLVDFPVIYDPKNNTYSKGDSVKELARMGHRAFLYGDDVLLLFGGVTDPLDTELFPAGNLPVAGINPDFVTSRITRYNPMTGEVKRFDEMAQARAFFSLNALNAQQLVIAGGTDGNTALSSVEIFEGRESIEIGDTEVTGNSGRGMSVGRVFHTATAIPSGEVIFIGGAETPGGNATGEVYTPKLEGSKGTVVPLMVSGFPLLVGAASMLTGDGKVFIYGGYNPVEDALADKFYRMKAVGDPGNEGLEVNLSEETAYDKRMHAKIERLFDGTLIILGGIDTEAKGRTKILGFNGPQ